MKKAFLLSCLLLFFSCSYSQLFITRTGFTSFYSHTSLEDVKAENNQVYAVIDATKKNIAFMLLMKSFAFEKELMQEHFNENYAETDKFPKATFSGTYTGNVDLTKNGTYNIVVSGALIIHGVTKNVQVPATLEVNASTLIGNAHFQVKPEDYNIIIPSLVRDKISPMMDINVKINCTQTK